MMPKYIHMSVAESILFAVKAIRVLRNPSPAFRFRDAYHLQVLRGSQQTQGFTGRFSFQREPLMDTKLIGEEFLPQSEADKIEAMFLDLKLVVVCADPKRLFSFSKRRLLPVLS